MYMCVYVCVFIYVCVYVCVHCVQCTIMSSFKKLKKYGNDLTSPIFCTKFKLCHDFIHSNAESPQNDNMCVERVQNKPVFVKCNSRIPGSQRNRHTSMTYDIIN